MNNIEVKAEQKKEQNWLLSKSGVCVMLFLVLGVIGLPFLYKSKSFTTRGKVVMTLLVILYTFALVAIFVLFMIWIWKVFSEMNF